MHFDYVLYNAGWAEARVTTEEHTVRMTASYVHDSVAELVNALLELRVGAAEARVVFMNEPGEHHLRLVRGDGEQLSVEVRWYRDWASWGLMSPEDYQIVLETATTVTELTEQVLESLDTILDTFRVEGYQEKWIEHEFPMREFARLQRVSRRPVLPVDGSGSAMGG